MKEIIILKGLDLKGYLWYIPESWIKDGELYVPTQVGDRMCRAVYKDSGDKELYMTKNRRVWTLDRIVKSE